MATTPRNRAPTESILPPGWPTRRLKRWPISRDFAFEKQKKRISTLGYQKVVGAVRALFTDDALVDTVIGLQDFCFQQGEASNANPRDRAFFFDALTHDLVFFTGDRDHPIIEDLPLDPKVYDALPHMRASFLDVYRVEKRGALGGAVLWSLTRKCEVKAGVRPLRGPKQGEHFVGRVVQIGRGAFVDDPILRLEAAQADAVVATFESELDAVRTRFSDGPEISVSSLLKVGGYHLYERAAAAQLAAETAAGVRDLRFAPEVVRYRVRKAREMLDLASLSGVRVEERDRAGRAVLGMIDLAPDANLVSAVREALVSIDGRDLLVMSFVDGSRGALYDELAGQLPSTVLRSEEPLEPNEVYRSLRHTLKKTG